MRRRTLGRELDIARSIPTCWKSTRQISISLSQKSITQRTSTSLVKIASGSGMGVRHIDMAKVKRSERAEGERREVARA